MPDHVSGLGALYSVSWITLKVPYHRYYFKCFILLWANSAGNLSATDKIKSRDRAL